MTGKIIDNSAPVALALILPIALVLVVLYTAWPFILLLAAAIVAWKIWENYQWRKLSQKVNPFFNQLVKKHQGCLTLTDLSTEADLSPRVAKQYLEKKAEEYGAQRQQIDNKGTVYYFLTASALGSMFEDSEPVTTPETEELAPQASTSSSVDLLEKPKTQPLPSEIAQLVDLEREPISTEEEPERSAHNVSRADLQDRSTDTDNSATDSHLDARELSQEESTDEEHSSDLSTHQSLIQAELAKRLALNSSTVGRRKSDPDFPEWSKSKDPEGIAWKYVSQTKVFVAVDEETESN